MEKVQQFVLLGALKSKFAGILAKEPLLLQKD